MGLCSGPMKKWKKECNNTLRNQDLDDDIFMSRQPALYKKVNDTWTAPNDGKCYWPERDKAYRK